MLTVYLSSQHIQAVIGTGGKSISIKRIVQAPVPEGLFGADVVTEPEQLSEFLTTFWRKHKLPQKGVTVVLGGNAPVNRVVETPAMKPNALLEYIPREFADLGRGEDVVFGCFQMSEVKKTKQLRLFATAVARKYLKDILGAFSTAGVTVDEVCSGLGSSIAFLSRLPAMKGQTAVVQIWNGSLLTNILVVDGVYTYSNSSRPFNDPGTPGFAVEVTRQVSQLLQFMKAQQMDSTVEWVYLAGMDDEDVSLCIESIFQVNPDIQVDAISGEGLIASEESELPFHYALAAVGALCVEQGSRTGLYKQFLSNPEVVAARKKRKRTLIPILSLAGVAAVAVLVLVGIALFYNNRLNTLVAYNTSPLVIAATAEYDSLMAENTGIQAQLDELTGDKAALESYPLPNSRVNAVLESCAGSLVEIQVSSYSASTGVISTTTTSANVENINSYIALLNMQEVFSSVEYTGYTYNNSTAMWTVNVTCTLAENAGR